MLCIVIVLHIFVDLCVCVCVQVNNACATGSSALNLAKQMVEGGTANCVLAVGFEKMQRGSLGQTVWKRERERERREREKRERERG